MNETADVIEQAADLIRRDGLHKGQLWAGDDRVAGVVFQEGVPITYQPGSPCCVMGALYVTVGARKEAVAVSKVISEAIACNVANWNDRFVTTQDEVVDTLLDIAKDLRNGNV